MDDLAQAVKALTEELKTFRERLTIELTDGTRVTAFEYLADQLSYLSGVVESHAITPTADEQETQDECDERQ